MNKNTVRFGVVRAIAFGAFLAAGAWAGEAAASTLAPLDASELAGAATRNDLITAPRLLVDPTQ